MAGVFGGGAIGGAGGGEPGLSFFRKKNDGVLDPAGLRGFDRIAGRDCGLLAGQITDSTLVGSLTAFLVYSALLFGGCWLLYQSIPAAPVGMAPPVAETNARVLAEAARGVICFGVFCFLTGGSICAVFPIVFRRLIRNYGFA